MSISASPRGDKSSGERAKWKVKTDGYECLARLSQGSTEDVVLDWHVAVKKPQVLETSTQYCTAPVEVQGRPARVQRLLPKIRSDK